MIDCYWSKKISTFKETKFQTFFSNFKISKQNIHSFIYVYLSKVYNKYNIRVTNGLVHIRVSWNDSFSDGITIRVSLLTTRYDAKTHLRC